MRKITKTITFLVFLQMAAAFGADSVTVVSATADEIGACEPWERILESSRDYESPCMNVEVRYEAAGPDGQIRKGLGFWDGDRRFVIRSAFPSPGEWHWRTDCSDASNEGLHGRSGTVRVTPANGRDLFRAHGRLRISVDGRLLVHADDKPFFWLGDTCWAAPVQATADEWKRYIANRASKGYSVVQVAIARDWMLKNSRSEIAPFLSELPDITIPNPVYFRELDKKVALANDSGLAVLMVGLMETPYRFPAREQSSMFCRYVAARYASFEVIFSPSFDSGIHEAETLAAASAIRLAAPDSLVTMHLGTGVGPRFHAADWLAFDMFQSGHNGGDDGKQSARATGMPAEILALPNRKPVINGEAIYEGEDGCAYDVRRTAWLSFLSGAVGYTAGIDEIYLWNENALALMDAPSSDQVALVGRILRQMPWTQMEPAPERILNQPKNKSLLMAFGLAEDRSWGLAYAPGNKEVILDLAGSLPVYDVLWINPATGNGQTGEPVNTSGRTALRPPDERDWLAFFSAPDSALPERIRSELDAVAFKNPAQTATIAFSKDSTLDGLMLKTPADGRFVRETFNGVACVVNKDPKRNSYFYLDVDDRLAFRKHVPRLRLEVRLSSDEPLDGIMLQYDTGGREKVEDIYRPMPPAWRKQEDGWTVLGFEIDKPFLGSAQNSGADFRLFLEGRLCRIASARVDLSDGLSSGGDQ